MHEATQEHGTQEHVFMALKVCCVKVRRDKYALVAVLCECNP